MHNNLLIEPQYLAPVQTFSKLLIYKKIIIDDQQIFEKQTYRNRAIISGANNLIPLVVPVQQGKTRLAVGEVKIDYSENWQHQHWHSIQAAYGKTPFFFHFEEELKPFFHTNYKLLLDLNISLMNKILLLLGIENNILTLSEAGKTHENFNDFRSAIHPKSKYRKEDPEFKAIPYQQAFIERFGFIENLSIIDLLFNEGPVSREVLLKSAGTCL